VDIQSDTEFAQAEAEAAFAGADGDDFTGRCVAILSNGKRCPNAALPSSRFCGIPAHQELARRDEAGEDLGALIVQPGAAEPEEAEEGDELADAVEAEVEAEAVAEELEEIAGEIAAGEASQPVAASEPATEPAPQEEAREPAA